MSTVSREAITKDIFLWSCEINSYEAIINQDFLLRSKMIQEKPPYIPDTANVIQQNLQNLQPTLLRAKESWVPS